MDELWLIRVACVMAALWGVLDLFFGYRIFKITLVVLGLVVGIGAGAVVGERVFGENTDNLLIAAGIGGILGAFLSLAFFKVAVFLLGAALGFTGAAPFVADFAPLTAWLILGGAALLGGVLALWLIKIMIKAGTAFTGAYRVIYGAIGVMHPEALQGSATIGEGLAELVSEYRMWMLGVVLLGVVGFAVQLFSGRKESSED